MEREDLANLIVDYRARNNLTIRQMAEMCGVSFLTIWNIENGKHNTSRITAKKITNAIKEDRANETI